MATKQYDISEGKFAISMSDLLKLLGIVAAVGMSYAMASSRLSLIEKGIRDGQESVIRVEARLQELEGHFASHESQENDILHEYDLRLQSLEERNFGESRSSSMSRRSAPRRPRTGSMNNVPSKYTYIPPTEKEETAPKPTQREDQYKKLNL